MSMYIPANPVAKPILIPIQRAISKERMRIEEIEWETGQRPSTWWLDFLKSEAERGVTQHLVDLELTDATD